MKKRLSHYDEAGQVSMVDVSDKQVTERTAVAYAYVKMKPAVIKALPGNKKGDPLEVARIAGIGAAKKTYELIPLCHQLPLSHVAVHFEVEKAGIAITVTAKTSAQTGVEMEALTAAAIAALTIYDMTKALDKGTAITDIHLIEKTGGKSGRYRSPKA